MLKVSDGIYVFGQTTLSDNAVSEAGSALRWAGWAGFAVCCSVLIARNLLSMADRFCIKKGPVMGKGYEVEALYGCPLQQVLVTFGAAALYEGFGWS